MATGEESLEEEFDLGSPLSQTIDRGEEQAADTVFSFEFEQEFETAAESPDIPMTSQPTGSGGNTPQNPPIGGGGNTLPNPPAPKFGGLTPYGNPWIGGPPKQNWEGTIWTSEWSPHCSRMTGSAKGDTYAYQLRTEGLSTKFKRDDPEFPLLSFADECLRHMEKHGMDTVFCMTCADSIGKGAMELFTHHSRFTKSSVDEFIKTAKDPFSAGGKNFDSHCQRALQESADWLIASLDESLKSSIRPQLHNRPTGPQVWMMIVAEVQSNSLRRADALTKQFNAMKLTDFKGENVKDYAKSASALLTQLEREEQLPKTHLLTIVDAFTGCSVMDFKIQWMAKRDPVEAFLKEAAGKDKAVVLAMPNCIHFSHLLDSAKDSYMNLLPQWGPSKDAIDGPETALLTQLKALTGKVDKLDQQLKMRDKQDNDKEASNPPASESDRKKKWLPPKDGEPKTKTMFNKTWHWCSKCNNGKGRWNRSHLTEAHKDNFQRESSESSDSNSTAPGGHTAQVDSDDDALGQWLTLRG